jgi:hypothetical protein
MTMINRTYNGNAGILLMALLGCSVLRASAQTPEAACLALAELHIPPSAIGLPTTGATIASAELVRADAPDNANGEYCKVLGAIHPATYSAPDINFEVNLPSAWNRKMLQFGGGGLNGTLVNGLGHYMKQPTTEATPLARGYVTLGSDSGHQSAGGFDGRFYLNEEAMDNYGHMQIKKTHDVAVALVEARYKATAEHSYFLGGSQGGHEGFDALQRYPADYDGVVAGYPAHNVLMLHLSALQFTKAMLANDGASWINPHKAAMVVEKVYGACDALDAASDGIISNVTACLQATADFRLQTSANPLRCDGGRDTGNNCLSDAQIEALLAFDQPFETGFPVFADDEGTAVFPKWTPFEGSTFRDGGQVILGAQGPRSALQASPADATNRFAIARDLTLDVFSDFDPLAYAGRISDVAPRISANSIAIEPFRDRGGKLIFFHGLVDDFITPYSSIQYYERLQKRFGTSLDDFVRFYTIPGMGHVTGVFNARVSMLDALEAWVEKGVPPQGITAMDANRETAGRTRPVCHYPMWPQYNGSGDINNAASFSCVR